jgi:hypothetical protein
VKGGIGSRLESFFDDREALSQSASVG